MQKPLSIIGLDPGTTAAYSILDLNGNLIKSYSQKQLPLSQIISQIINLSQPLITSTDKQKPPSLVQDFAAKLGTLLISPKQDLKKEEKENLVKIKTPNHHQHDSLAAALYAHKKLKPTLTKIDHFLKTRQLEKIRNPFTQLILKENLNFELAQKILTKPEKETKIIQKVIEKNQLTKINFLNLYQKINNLKKEKTLLENKITSLSQSLSHLKQTNLFLAKKLTQTNKQIDLLLQFKEKRIKLFSQELDKKQNQNRLLQKQLQELKQLLFEKNKIIIKKTKDLGQNFKKQNPNLKEGDYLFVENPHILSQKIQQQLKEKGIKLFSKTKRKGFFPLTQFQDQDDFIITDKNTIEKSLSQRDILGEVMEEHRKRNQLG